MKKKLNTRNILISLLVLFILLQFFGADRSTPEPTPGSEIFERLEATDEIQTLIKGACYDCHSYQTSYPWYGYVAPVSWLLQSHIDEAREHMNFSIWSSYTEEEMDDKLDECFEEIAKEKMPLKAYTWLHPEADLTEAQRVKLLGWFKKNRLLLKNSEK